MWTLLRAVTYATFGDEYDAYRSRVGRWLPRL
jgi:protein-S-isoprenylcysteine O-methyltransferase Ste14